MGLIHSFCMNGSNKIYVLNKKKKAKQKKHPKTKKKKCTGFSKICFYAEECNFSVFHIQRLRETQLFFPIQQAKIIIKMITM